MTNDHPTRAIVLRELELLLMEEGVGNTEISDEDNLVEIGVDSLAFAVLITRLEDLLNIDPFMTIEEITLPRTVNELVLAYATYQGDGR